MAKKLRFHTPPEEPPSSKGEWWYLTTYRHGKIRRIKFWIEKKRHRQSPPIEVSVRDRTDEG